MTSTATRKRKPTVGTFRRASFPKAVTIASDSNSSRNEPKTRRNAGRRSESSRALNIRCGFHAAVAVVGRALPDPEHREGDRDRQEDIQHPVLDRGSENAPGALHRLPHDLHNHRDGSASK